MKVLLDENVAKKFRFYLAPHGFEVQTAQYAGLAGYENGRLLNAAEGRFDVLITHDKGIEYQNNLKGRKISVLVVHAQLGLTDMIAHLDTIIAALRVIYPGEVIHVGVGITFNMAARVARQVW